jgi:16S rRNA (uracil1498-N3)-methyltransferase
MRMTRVYHPQVLVSGSTIPLTETAAAHLVRVLRLRENAALHVFNGQGGAYQAIISQIKKNQVFITLGEFIPGDQASPLHTHLGQAIARGEKMDFILQKAVELGVSEITPLFTEHSNVQLPADRIEKRLQHWQGVIISACEQCGLNRLPVLHSPQDFKVWIHNQTADLKLILHPDAAQDLTKIKTKVNSVVVTIGPEGGFSEQEIKIAQHFQALCLGTSVLRTETAGLAALSVLQYQFGDLHI